MPKKFAEGSVWWCEFCLCLLWTVFACFEKICFILSLTQLGPEMNRSESSLGWSTGVLTECFLAPLNVISMDFTPKKSISMDFPSKKLFPISMVFTCAQPIRIQHSVTFKASWRRNREIHCSINNCFHGCVCDVSQLYLSHEPVCCCWLFTE